MEDEYEYGDRSMEDTDVIVDDSSDDNEDSNL